MPTENSGQLTATARSVLKKTAPHIRERGSSPELREYFKAASGAAQRVVDGDLTSSKALADISRFRLISQGMIATGTLVTRDVDIDIDADSGSNFPGMDRYLCMAKCLKAYHDCVEAEGGGGNGDEPEDDDAIDVPDDEGDDDVLGGLGCYLSYANCLSGCTPPSV